MIDPLYRRLLGHTRPYRLRFGLALLGMLVLAASEPAIPALIKPLLDGSFVARDPFFIQLMPPLLMGLFLVRGVAGFASNVALQWVAHRVVLDLRRAMFARLLMLPGQRFDELTGGSLLSRFTYDVNQVMQACTSALVVLVRDSLAVAGLLAWILYLNWRLALIAFLVAPAIALVMRIASRRQRRMSRRLQQAMGDLNHVIDEAIDGQREIKAFGGQDYEQGRFDVANERTRRYAMKLITTTEATTPGVQFLAVMALGLVVYLASRQAMAGEVTVGGFVSLFGAIAMLFAPLKRLTRLNETLQRGLAAAESVFALIDETPEPDHGGATPPRVAGEIRFEAVSLTYPGRRERALDGIDLHIRAGETLALVGPSGGGKSSLIHLLPRFVGPGGGRILLDGIDIHEWPLALLRRQLAYVGQHPVLFNDTLAANIGYGAGRALDAAELAAVAARADALEFIRALPEGFDTPVGDNGVRLSGGQRQRIAIARALARNAPILLLDEATSALDADSERRVQRGLEQDRHNRTTLVVAHRLSTVENADRIVVLAGGRLIEQGDHRELLARDGVYARLYREQTPGNGDVLRILY